MKEKIGLYAGSFDPLTFGHLSIIVRACTVVDRLIIGVGTNPDKKQMFDSDARVKIIEDTMKEGNFETSLNCKIEVIKYDNQFLSDIADDLKVTHIIRGLRSSKDFEEEQALQHTMQKYFESYTPFVYFIARQELATLSSTMVKNCLNFKYWEEVVCNMVPPPSFRELKKIKENS